MTTPTNAETRPTSTPRWLVPVVLLAGIVAVYAQHVATGGFLNFDDPFFFDPRQNARFAQGWDVILDPSRPIANAFLPVAHGSLYLDHLLGARWDQGEWIVHLHSVFLHWLAAIALWTWLRRLSLSPWAAGAAAAVFAVHPALGESVAWASSRKDVLAGLFTFLTLALLLAGRGGRTPTWAGLLALLTGTLALYSKSTAVVLPLLALLSSLALPKGRARPWGWVAGLFAIAIAAGLHHQAVAVAEGTLRGGRELAETLPQVPGAFGHYVETAAWPAHLNILYPEVQTLEAFARDPWALPLVLGLVVLGAALAFVPALRRMGFARVGMGILLFFAAILPFNTAFPASSIAAADRYLYLAIPGLALALAALPRVGMVVAGAAALACVPLAFQRVQDFRDSEAVWSASLAEDPANAVAAYNLYLHYEETRGVDRERRRELIEAAAAAARYPEQRRTIHGVLRELTLFDADYESAVRHADAVVEAYRDLVDRLDIDPASVVAETESRRGAGAEVELSPQRIVAYGLVTAHMRAFRPCLLAASAARSLGLDGQAAAHEAAAERHLAAIRELAPDSAEVLAFEATLLLVEATKTEDEAEREALWQEAGPKLEKVLAAQPGHYEANLARGNWERLRGKPLLALRYLLAAKEALTAEGARLFDGQGWTDLVEHYLSQDMFAEAERTALEGLNVYGVRDPKLLYLYATALYSQQKWAEAELHLETYVERRPTDRDARRILAIILSTRAISRLAEMDADALRKAIARAAEYAPGEVRIDYLRGHLALKERRFGDAAVFFGNYLEVVPGDVDALERRVDALVDRGYELMLGRDGDEDAAAAIWIEALMLAPPTYDRTKAIRTQLDGYARRLVQRASGLLKEGRAVEAEELLRRARRASPEQGAYLLGLALLLGENERERAARRLERWTGEPTASDRGSRERLQEAAALFAHAASIAPTVETARLADYYRVRVLLRLGLDDRARALGEDVLADPETPADLADRVRQALQ